MGELAQILDYGRSGDILLNDQEGLEDKHLEERMRQESGPVKTTLDLSQFMVFNRNSYQRGTAALTVKACGRVYISSALGAKLKLGAKVEFLLNRKGTILVMREAKDGFTIYRGHGHERLQAKAVSCRALARTLKEMGAEFPVRFRVEWDDDLQAWVGRKEPG